MIPKVKATKTSKIQSVLQDFPEEFKRSANNGFCEAVRVSCNNRFLVESHLNMFKHQITFGITSELLIPYTLQTFLKSSNTDFAEKVTKAFLSSDIALCKLNNKHIKNLFHNIGQVCHQKLIVEK